MGECATGQSPAPAEVVHTSPKCVNQTRSTYLLGADDQLEIPGPDLTDSGGDKRARIDSDGDVQAPLVGRMLVAGLTVQQAEEALDKPLSKYICEPQVVLNVAEVRSQPVSILGAVNTPGVHQVQGHKTLLQMLASAGGIRVQVRDIAFASSGNWSVASPCRAQHLISRTSSAWQN